MIAYGSRIRRDAKLDSDHLDVSAFENEDDPFVENVRREGAMILDCGDRILAPPYDPDLAELIDGYRDTVEKYDELHRRLAE